MGDMNVFGQVRQLLQGIDRASVGDTEQFTLSEQLEMMVAQGSSQWEETTKMGRSFSVCTASAVAALVAVPTVVNMLSLWNGELQTGRVLIIDRVWALCAAASGATAGQGALIGCLGQTAVASLATLGLAINANNGLGSKDTKVINSNTNLDAVTGVAANWRVLPGQTGGVKVGAAATPGYFINADVNGRMMVPPGRLFAIHVVADVVTQTFIGGIEWHEKVISLG